MKSLTMLQLTYLWTIYYVPGRHWDIIVNKGDPTLGIREGSIFSKLKKKKFFLHSLMTLCLLPTICYQHFQHMFFNFVVFLQN